LVWFYSDQAPCHPTNTMQFRPREFPALGRAPGARQLQMAARGQLATQAVLTCTDRTWDAAHRCTSYMDQSTEARQLRHNTLPDGEQGCLLPAAKGSAPRQCPDIAACRARRPVQALGTVLPTATWQGPGRGNSRRWHTPLETP